MGCAQESRGKGTGVPGWNHRSQSPALPNSSWVALAEKLAPALWDWGELDQHWVSGQFGVGLFWLPQLPGKGQGLSAWGHDTWRGGRLCPLVPAQKILSGKPLGLRCPR